MFSTPTDATVYALAGSKKYLHRLVAGLKPEDFEFQPVPGANCIAWILGHLTLTERRQLRWLGIETLPALPEGFEERFATTRTKASVQSGFGDPQELIAAFDAHRDLLIASLPDVDPAILATPVEPLRPMFNSLAEATLFMALHTMLHLGQISTIRRARGYDPLS